MKATIDIAAKMNLRCILSQDPFMHSPERKNLSDLLHAIRTNKSMDGATPHLFAPILSGPGGCVRTYPVGRWRSPTISPECRPRMDTPTRCALALRGCGIGVTMGSTKLEDRQEID